MTNRKRINQRKRQEFIVCIGASALAILVAALATAAFVNCTL
jgi:hypothetical protein